MYLKSLFAIILLLMMSGCASIYQTKQILGSEDEKVGITRQYYLPRGLVSISGTVDEKKEVSVTVESKLVPDEKAKKLYLVPHHSWWYDDNFVVETTKDGLLTSVTTKSTYKGIEIAEQIGAFAGAVAKIVPLAELKEKEKEKEEEEEKTCVPALAIPFTVHVDIDPYNKNDLQLKELNANCFFLEIGEDDRLKDWEDALKQKFDQAKKQMEKEKKFKQVEEQTDKTETPGIPGIVYRDPFNLLIKIEYKGKGDDVERKLYSFWVTIPDRKTVRSAPVNRGVFVTRQHDYTFSNGMLTKSTLDYPSEIYGLITTPLSLLNGVAQAITGRFDTAKESAANEAAYLDARRQLLEARKNLEDMKK
ncbi:hypothetical protein SAMN05216403_13222 [Nitrosospira multiformis ATCC 25196]|uniref:Lipoprotein n=1 Tax=Nitrosospira multiformis (strain ATCC 25196 / NCIMB 11849 / C 71) TaxID=323848 RepID=Q2YCU7_NITMU|nr:hypothetical protein [Nitrosospira multiformis]ABB73424.1 hypothetical protein Nmul_A0115 [Nitrosospira multiformis ATCC 25196]SEG12005.1 hypothetical protein SAMN05216403_13222 [Nitrosospira multiformis ATCC 25196]